MMRVAACALLCLPLVALPEELPAEDEKPHRIESLMPVGTVKRILEPEYPAQLLAGKAKVFIDISGRINPFGGIEEVEIAAETDEARLMIQPVKDALRYWQFESPTDKECQPAPVVVRNRVWFEFGGEKVKLSVSRLAKEEASGDGYSYKASNRVEPQYPHRMLQSGLQAFVYAKMKVSSEGEVLEVTATAYPTGDGDRLKDFELATYYALSKWRFPPRAKGNWTGCYTIVFRLR